MCGVFRYNISAESPAKSTLSQGHGLSTGGGELYGIYIYTHMLYLQRNAHTYVEMVLYIVVSIYLCTT